MIISRFEIALNSISTEQSLFSEQNEQPSLKLPFLDVI
jgi:hypothetical protein